ncbi:hypothetical protein HaLaN_12323, partial [Haematococcus lacustris]
DHTSATKAKKSGTSVTSPALPSKAPVEADVDVSGTPADTFRGLIPDLDFDNDQALVHAAPILIARRWGVLRAGVPEDEVPRYADGEHVKGIDSLNTKRALKELVSASTP